MDCPYSNSSLAQKLDLTDSDSQNPARPRTMYDLIEELKKTSGPETGRHLDRYQQLIQESEKRNLTPREQSLMSQYEMGILLLTKK